MAVLQLQQIPPALFAAEHAVHEAKHVEDPLRELVCLRVSQLNGCHYCIDMHRKECEALGVPVEKLDELPDWAQSPLFSTRERTALQVADYSVRLEQGPGTSLAEQAEHALGTSEARELIVIIAMIHMWNRLAILGGWEVGKYRAGDLGRLLART